MAINEQHFCKPDGVQLLAAEANTGIQTLTSCFQSHQVKISLQVNGVYLNHM